MTIHLPSRTNRNESLSRFWIAWISVSIVAAAFMYPRPVDTLVELGLREELSPYLGLLYLGQLIVFWSVAAVGQWLVLRRQLLHGGRWGVVTFVGGLIATFGYIAAGWALQPIWMELFRVKVSPVGVALYLFQTNNFHQTFFFAVQGVVFGWILASLQSLVSPFPWRSRLYFVALSTLAGGVALGLVWFVHATAAMTPVGRYSGMVLRAIGVMSFVSPLLWIVYSALTGIGLQRLIARWRQSGHDAITSSFD